MFIYFSLVLVIVLAYVLGLTVLIISWNRISPPSPSSTEFPFVSIVIAVRNEADTIQDCLNSVFTQDYPGHAKEVILVDNHSTDRTVSICREMQKHHALTILELAKTHAEAVTFKKQAVEAGVHTAKGDIIMTTDGDCVVKSTWVSSMVAYFTLEKLRFVTGPVVLQTDTSSFLQKYQQLELQGLMVATGGGIRSQLMLLANGANMAFLKKDFLETAGYRENANISSGDDVFLLHQMFIHSAGKVGFIKSNDAVVLTKGADTYWSFFQQRKRWTGKSASYDHIPTKGVAALVALNAIVLGVTLILAIFLGSPYTYLLVIQLLCKVIVDTWLIYTGSIFLSRSLDWLGMIPVHLYNPVASWLVLMMAVFSRKYWWKGRITK